MVAILEDIMYLAFLIIFFCGVAHMRQLKKAKWKRKLTKGEMTMYLALSLATFVYTLLYFVLLVGT